MKNQLIKKCCTKCNIEKPLSEFPRDKQKKSGYSPQCKDCRNARPHKSLVDFKTNPTTYTATAKVIKEVFS